MPRAELLRLLLLNAARLIRHHSLLKSALGATLFAGILLPSDWTLSYAFAKQTALPAALVALSGLVLSTVYFDWMLARMDRLTRDVDGGRGLDRNLVFLEPHMRVGYDQWSRKCANQRMVEWLAILWHLAFHIRLARKPTCTLRNHLLVTVTWSQQLWTAIMRHKFTVRGRSLANMMILLWLFTVHTLLIASGDQCVSNDGAFMQGSILSAVSVSAIFLLIVFNAFPVSVAHAPYALTFSATACTAIGYLQFLPPSLGGNVLLTGMMDLDAADPGRWGLLATMLASCISAQLTFVCRCVIEEAYLHSFLASRRRDS